MPSLVEASICRILGTSHKWVYRIMKNSIFNTFLVACLLLCFSCSKDQKHVDWISPGDYNLTSAIKNGEEWDRGYTLHSYILTYSNCKIKDGECDALVSIVFSYFGSNEIITRDSYATYTILEKGSKLQFTTLENVENGMTTPCTNNCTGDWDFLEITKDRHVIAQIDNDGASWELTFEKR